MDLLTGDLSRRTFLGSVAALWIPASGGAETLHRNVALYGSEAPLPDAISLRAGPVTALFEPGTGFLRYVRYGEHEILRGLYVAVRDKVWGTVTPAISNVTVETKPESFRLSFDVDCRQDDIDFGWRGLITGSPDGTVRFEFDGTARVTFLKNRLGFAVLHPIRECAGKKAYIEQADGLKKEGMFPGEISPNQPMLNLRAVSHELARGVMAEVRFEGDIFEMEDHRNWTDMNYKTYCTPLERPFPVEVQRGQSVKQAVTIRLKGGIPGLRWQEPQEVEIGKGEGESRKVPMIGSSFAVGQPKLTPKEVTRLRALGLKHLRVDVDLSREGWRDRWGAAVSEATALNVPLEAAVFVGANPEQELAALATMPAKVARWMVFHREEKSTREKWISLARQHLKGAPVGAGTNEYFTELNRERPPAAAIDFTCYSLNPQVHAFDNRSLMENLEGQAETVKTCHQFAGGKAIAVTPVTLRPRFNPQAAGQPEPVVEGKLPSRIDPRQPSLLAAAWTLGSVKYLAESGASSITYYETHGWNGLMETEKGSPSPELFGSVADGVFPLYHVLADVNELAAGNVEPLWSADSLRVCGMALRFGRRRRVLLANLTPRIQPVVLPAAIAGRRARVRLLDETTFEEAVRSPEAYRRKLGNLTEASGDKLRVTLLPYGVARIDVVA